MNKLAVVILAAGLPLAACAPEPGGQQPAPQPGAQSASEPTFEVVDSNKDGKVSRDEAGIVQGLDFGTADANSDSMLDRLEYTAAIAEISRSRG
ncbi:MAG TPA: EF-hand domain-containing protein [Gammaproteobacteria bacterium]|nr:EF-hand domain-containing protein [Gammaproteobacteria bacterium]